MDISDYIPAGSRVRESLQRLVDCQPDFFVTSLEAFRFLIDDFGFKVAYVDANHVTKRIWFLNSRTGIIVLLIWEMSEWPFCKIGRPRKDVRLPPGAPPLCLSPSVRVVGEGNLPKPDHVAWIPVGPLAEKLAIELTGILGELPD